MSSQSVLISFENNIARVCLNRPEKRNAWDYSMFLALDNALKQVRNQRGLRAVVIQGNGEDFSSGLDVKSIMSNPKQAARLLSKFWFGKANLAQRVCIGWSLLPIPVIAAIHGRCWGAGMQLALSADIRIAEPSSSLSIMESRWGLVPDMGGLTALRRLMPYDQALDLTLSARETTAATAQTMGLVTRLSENPLHDALCLANEYATRSPDAIAASKRLYQKYWNSKTAKILSKETWYQLRLLMGRNQRIAAKRQVTGASAEYRTRGHW